MNATTIGKRENAYMAARRLAIQYFSGNHNHALRQRIRDVAKNWQDDNDHSVSLAKAILNIGRNVALSETGESKLRLIADELAKITSAPLSLIPPIEQITANRFRGNHDALRETIAAIVAAGFTVTEITVIAKQETDKLHTALGIVS